MCLIGAGREEVQSVEIVKGSIVNLPNLFLLRCSSLHFGELVNSNRGLNVRHVVLKSCTDDLVMFDPLIRKSMPCIFRQPMKGQALNGWAHSSRSVMTIPPSTVVRFFVT